MMRCIFIFLIYLFIIPILLPLGCAKGESPVLDVRPEHGYDFIYDPSVDVPPDYPFEPGYDVVPDTPYDYPVDTGGDTGPCSETPCGLKPNCGCPAGQKCSLDDTASRACVQAGTGSTGSTCMDDAECAAGYLCLATNPDGTMGACFPYCNADTDCTGNGSICVELATADGPIPNAAVCTYACDLVTNSGCPTGHGCDLYGMDRDEDGNIDVDFTDCNSMVGAGTQGAYCTDESGCAPGYSCYTTELICLGYCFDPGGISSCPSSTECIGFETPAYIGGREVGVCY